VAEAAVQKGVRCELPDGKIFYDVDGNQRQVTERPVKPGRSAFVRLQIQTALTDRLGQDLHAAVELVRPAIEHHLLDPLFEGPSGKHLADFGRGVLIAGEFAGTGGLLLDCLSCRALAVPTSIMSALPCEPSGPRRICGMMTNTISFVEWSAFVCPNKYFRIGTRRCGTVEQRIRSLERPRTGNQCLDAP